MTFSCATTVGLMTRVIVDKVAKSDITIAQWLRSLPNAEVSRIAVDARDPSIRELARTERGERLWNVARSA